MKGEIKIRLGNDNQEPMFVYVRGWNSNFELWVCDKLNSGETVFSKQTELIDFSDYNDFKRMYYEWKIKQQDIIKNRFIEMLNECQI